MNKVSRACLKVMDKASRCDWVASLLMGKSYSKVIEGFVVFSSLLSLLKAFQLLLWTILLGNRLFYMEDLARNTVFVSYFNSSFLGIYIEYCVGILASAGILLEMNSAAFSKAICLQWNNCPILIWKDTLELHKYGNSIREDFFSCSFLAKY